MFEFKLNNSELDALNTLVETVVVANEACLPEWNYNGQNVWEMNFDGDDPEVTVEWAIEAADVA